MEHIHFEDFLKERHMKEYHGTDNYEKWVCELETSDIIALADLAVYEGEIRCIKSALQKN